MTKRSEIKRPGGYPINKRLEPEFEPKSKFNYSEPVDQKPTNNIISQLKYNLFYVLHTIYITIKQEEKMLNKKNHLQY